MTKTPADEVLANIPKKAPVWAVGITTIIIAVVSSVVTIYVVSKEDIKQVISWSQKHNDQKLEIYKEEEILVLGNVMKLLNIKSQQILELSKAVATTQQNNFVLMQRVDKLEKDILDLKSTLGTCERELKICRERK